MFLRVYFPAILLIGFLPIGGTLMVAGADRPNVLWFVVDDMSANFSCYGETLIDTPHVDRLASEGTRFTKAFVTAPVCSSSRSAMIAGMYQTTIGAHHHRSGRGKHLPDRLAGEAASFIEAHRDEPFLVYYPFYDVHTPLMAREDLRKKYEEKRVRLGLEAKWGREGESDVRLVQEHAVYAAMVEAMDLAVGRVLAKLDELGLAENTLVLFTSDNGGLSTSDGSPTSNLPLRGGKGWMYEGGIREPLVVRWPAKIKPGSVSSVPVSSPDFFPTFLEAAGAKKPGGLQVDGFSLVPVFTGGTLPERSLFWHYPHYGNQGGAPAAAIRKGTHKLIRWFEEDRVELFDLSNDLAEAQNLAPARPDLVDALGAELISWQEDVGAKFPTSNPAYDPAKPSGRAAVGKPEASAVKGKKQ